MDIKKKGRFELSEEALVKVLARSSSLRSIARYLRVSEHLLFTVVVNHDHGCKKWGLTKSLGSWMMRYEPETTVRKVSVLNCAGGGLVLLYIETSKGAPVYHVGNPLFRQWARIPFPPYLSGYDVSRLQEQRFLFNDTGLVTKMEKGVVVGYKVVWTLLPCYVTVRRLSFGV
ncbi:hypothetical protein EUTSA_v10023870mg [Eutrema salsugineum]|uniref:F-box protein At3g26010-like beta-propeller domain-containing protein n=1 Tax=Eutrema salsugineum TaxID=72664 RepID=V4KI12_EUTSA|nr:hypothetical protein EUTSA_v10023870mg [Eutrema salsugineum]